MEMEIEVCVPNAADYEAARVALTHLEGVTVQSTSLSNGSHACLAATGGSDPPFLHEGSALDVHLSAYTPWELFSARLSLYVTAPPVPVGRAVVLPTLHPRHTLLIYAPSHDGGIADRDPLATGGGVSAAFGAALAAARAYEIKGVSVELWNVGDVRGTSGASACEEMRNALALAGFRRGSR